jgi:hypothetical protein
MLTSRIRDSKREVNKWAGGKEGLEYGIVQVGVHANVTAEKWMVRDLKSSKELFENRPSSTSVPPSSPSSSW